MLAAVSKAVLRCRLILDIEKWTPGHSLLLLLPRLNVGGSHDPAWKLRLGQGLIPCDGYRIGQRQDAGHAFASVEFWPADSILPDQIERDF